MKPNEQDEMIDLFEFAKLKGIDAAKVVEMIRNGFYVGEKVGDDWFVSKTELYSDAAENQEYVTSLTKKLTLIELFVIFLYLVFIFNIEYGVFYLLLSPAIPLFFTISFLLAGLKFEKKTNFWKGMSVLNLILFIILTYIFWFVAFKNFR